MIKAPSQTTSDSTSFIMPRNSPITVEIPRTMTMIPSAIVTAGSL